MTIGKMIKMVRHDNGLKQEELAEMMTVGQSYISSLENDKEPPSHMFIRLFCKCFSLNEHAFQEGYIIPFKTMLNSEDAHKALDCMVQHLRSFCYQARNEETADFGLPCVECIQNGKCNHDWITHMNPLLHQSNIKIRMDCTVRPDTQDSDGRGPAPDKGIHDARDRNKHPFCNQQTGHA